MSRRLTDNVNSRYLEAANRLRPRRARRRVVAYVESYDDILFWRGVLDEFETDNLRFEVMLPSRSSLGKGKKTVLMNQLGPHLGDCMIACVDADYDYLLQGRTPVSEVILNSPYVFHTYAYAIENYQCFAPSLHHACVMATLNDHEVIDLEAFMEEYSLIVWPLFVWNVWCYRHNRYREFPIMDFCSEVMVKEVNPYHPELALATIRKHVNRKVAWLQSHFPQAKSDYAALRAELMQMGITPETTYLYMHGHSLFEGVVMPLLGPVCSRLRRERESEIRSLACHEKQMQNELSCYQHSQSSIEMMLRKSSDYRQCDAYQRMRADISRFVSEISAVSDSAEACGTADPAS